MSGEIVTRDEMARDKEKAKTNHIQASYPDQLSQDTFYLGLYKRDR